MKKIAIIFCLVFLAGCQDNFKVQQSARRAKWVARFQQVYPETWQKELLKYDIEIAKIRAQNPPPLPIIQPPQYDLRGLGDVERHYKEETQQADRDQSLRNIAEALRQMK